MALKRFNIIISIQVILLSLTVYLVFWSISKDYLKFTMYGFIVISIIQLVLIIFTVTRNNRNINNFLEAFVIKDASPKFTNLYQDKSFKRIQNSLNRISESYQEVKYEKESEHHFLLNTIEHIGTGIIAFEESGKVSLSNDAILSLFDMKTINNINQLNLFVPNFSEILNSININKPGLVRFIRNGVMIHLSIKASDMVIKAKKIRLVSFMDISNELAHEEVNNWQKLISVLRHEIMNSITPITTVASTLIDNIEESGYPEKSNKNIQIPVDITYKGLLAIKKRGEGLKDFVSSYKKVSNIPYPEFSRFLVYDLFNEIATLMGDEISSNDIQFNIEIDDENIVLNADEKLISQVLINLIRNSIQALTDCENKTIILSAEKSINGEIQINVIDKGPGISEEEIDKIFVPFFTTKEKGSGIGLSISRQIMNIHKAAIKVQSVPGKETVFSLIF
ncbi:PAS domain-containing sensor histidine kinase [Bacteroidota bacterium]